MGKKTEEQKRQWFRFWSPGLIFGESWDVEVPVGTKPKDVEWPEYAYCFQVVTRTDILKKGERFRGDSHVSPAHYYHPDSIVESYSQAVCNPKATRQLLSNMSSNNWDHIVWSRSGNWPQPFNPDRDVVIESSAK